MTELERGVLSEEEVERVRELLSELGVRSRLAVGAELQSLMLRAEEGHGVEREIREASKIGDVAEAVRRVEALWNRVERGISLAESRMRLLVRRMESPRLAPVPAWLEAQIEELKGQSSSELSPASPRAVDAAVRLVRAVLGQAPEREATVRLGPLGTVVVDWNTGARYSWVVRVARLPLPGVDARAFWEPTRGKMMAYGLHTVGTAVEHFLEHAERTCDRGSVDSGPELCQRAYTGGCVGTGDGRGERPRYDVGCACAWPGVTLRTVPEPVLERLLDGFGWHVTPLGREQERCTADDALGKRRE